MAIQLGIINYRGKLGQTVGRKKSRGQKAPTIAAYQPTVSNPKTLAQRQQRVKMAAAVNFYRALNGILNHSFQGVAYVGPSRSFFMKQALLMQDSFPYLPKGSMKAVPGNYLISKGSLPDVDVTLSPNNSEAVEGLISSDILQGFITSETIGEASENILSNAPYLQNGDQLTFIVVTATDSDLTDQATSFIYSIARFVIDVNSETSMANWANAQAIEIDVPESNCIKFKNLATKPYAAAIVISRPPLRKGGAWQRSTTYMTIGSEVQQIFMSTNARQQALDSYDNTESEVSSEWYLNQGTTDGQGAATGDGGSSSQRALTSVSVFVGGANRNFMVMTQGTNQYIVAGPVITSGENSGKRYLYTYSDGVAKFSDRTLYNNSDVSDIGMPLRLISTVQSYFPNLQVVEDENAGGGVIEDQP